MNDSPLKKIWYIRVENREEGPFSTAELRRDRRVTPFTLVWKKGMKNWLPAGKIPELASLFIDSTPLHLAKQKNPLQLRQELVLDSSQDPFLFIFWLIITLIILFYVWTKL